ncbi:MAG TPA: GNAT family N-acetyltransferase [Nannocystis sp.]
MTTAAVAGATVLTSARLLLRRMTADDLELLVRMHGDPRVMRYTGGVRDRAGSEAMLRDRILDYYADHPGLGVWATIERSTGACVGIHNLNHLYGEPDIQVGYLLYPEYWGRGYATEMCVALLRHGFGTVGLAKIVAITDPDNEASQHVLRKSGLVYIGERSLPHPNYADGPLRWFERAAADWLAEHPDRP